MLDLKPKRKGSRGQVDVSRTLLRCVSLLWTDTGGGVNP
jgi:hypothetical protein